MMVFPAGVNPVHPYSDIPNIFSRRRKTVRESVRISTLDEGEWGSRIFNSRRIPMTQLFWMQCSA